MSGPRGCKLSSSNFADVVFVELLDLVAVERVDNLTPGLRHGVRHTAPQAETARLSIQAVHADFSRSTIFVASAPNR